LAGVVLSGVLYLEMRAPWYLQDTAAFTLSYNALTEINPLFLSWPFAQQIRDALSVWIVDGELLKWVWQIVAMVGFTALNVLGVPLLLSAFIASIGMFRSRETRLVVLTLLGMVVLSLIIGIFLNLEYEPWSLSGQALLHIYWYLFPLLGWMCWRVYVYLQSHLNWTRHTWIVLGLSLVMIGALIRQFGTESKLRQAVRQAGYVAKPSLTPDEWETLLYIRQTTPQDAVLLVNQYVDSYQWVFSGNTGRRMYLEGAGGIVDIQTRKIFPDDDRREKINQVWGESDAAQFCELVMSTSATFLVEYQRSSLAAADPPCLTVHWTSPMSEVIVWQVSRGDAAQ
ncbi:MAG: hypothetical protein JNM70_18040, partial [Anaerolineae bacterium]|nr:hypothetical protein [Anaerolineae bacterium]